MKIKKIIFENHPIFEDRKFDFQNKNGKAYDTIVLAGENGTGKSSLLRFLNDIELLFREIPPRDLSQDQVDTYKFYERTEITIVLSIRTFINYRAFYKDLTIISRPLNNYYDDQLGRRRIVSSNFEKYATEEKWFSIYSPSNSGYKLTEKYDERKLGDLKNDISLGDTRLHSLVPKPDLIDQITYLFKALITEDNMRFLKAYKSSGVKKSEFKYDDEQDKTLRFMKAFNQMFEDKITFDNTDPDNIGFKKPGTSETIGIDSLSSGEKEIVVRSTFLLKEADLSNQGIILIDEPEISLHPKWQQKIFNFYIDLFSDSQGQNSQIVIATHSEHVLKSALQRDNTLIITIDENKNKYIESDIKDVVPNGFLLNTLTSAEIIFWVFSIYSVEYHQALFEKMISLYGIETYSDGNKLYDAIFSTKEDIDEMKVPEGWPKSNKRKEKDRYKPTYIRNYIDHSADGRTIECLNCMDKSIDFMIKKIKEQLQKNEHKS